MAESDENSTENASEPANIDQELVITGEYGRFRHSACGVVTRAREADEIYCMHEQARFPKSQFRQLKERKS